MVQPPQVEEQVVAAQVEQPDLPPAKADMSLRVFFDLQRGQMTGSSFPEEKTIFSNSALHFSHRYS